MSPTKRFTKRFIDVGLSAVALVLTSPVLLAAAALVVAESRGPVIYKGLRIGRGGRQFKIYKLRTMRVGAEKEGPSVTARGDPRITRVGRVLRRTKVDELPQLVNVLKGDMSLVGPRPEHPDYIGLYDERQRTLLSVRPGITSAASLAFHDEEERLSGPDPEREYATRIMPDKLEVDLRYIEHASVASDLRILLQTAGVVIGRLKPRKHAVPRDAGDAR